MNAIQYLQGLLDDIRNEQEVLERMDSGWRDDDDPTCDPGLQFEQGEKIERMTRDFFKTAAKLAPRYDGTDLTKYVIVYQDESYEAKTPDGSGFPTRLLSEARMFETREQAEQHAAMLTDVKTIATGYDLTAIPN